jgi:hypothetical protein
MWQAAARRGRAAGGAGVNYFGRRAFRPGVLGRESRPPLLNINIQGAPSPSPNVANPPSLSVSPDVAEVEDIAGDQTGSTRNCSTTAHFITHPAGAAMK